jgi:hypothetical protein
MYVHVQRTAGRGDTGERSVRNTAQRNGRHHVGASAVALAQRDRRRTRLVGGMFFGWLGDRRGRLVQRTGCPIAQGFYITLVAAAIGLMTLATVRETTGRPLAT